MLYVWTKRALIIGLLTLTPSLVACGKTMDKAQKAHAEAQSDVDLNLAQIEGSPQKNLLEGKAFLDKIAKQPGIKKLPSGIYYKLLSPEHPKAAKPLVTDQVTVNYEGKLINGQVFDSSFQRGEPVTFPLQQLVPAWQIAIPEMHIGEIWEIYVPSELGYGAVDQGPIPANSTLVFKIQLIDIVK